MDKRAKELKRRIERIREHYDLDALLAHGTGNDDVAKYYRLSDFFYNLIHSGGGRYIHMSVSDDGRFHREGFLYHARLVSEYINGDNVSVLELGAGRLANTRYLAKKFPKVRFTALDLPKRNFLKNRAGKNVELVEGDYNDLSGFPAESFDVVFAVETISYSENKERVVKEVSRVLRPGGVFVSFDIYEAQPRSKMTELQEYVSDVTLAAMRLTRKDHYIGNTEKYLKRNGFVDVEIKDYSKRIQPTLKRLERVSRYYYEHPRLAKAIRKSVAEDVTINSIAGYLMSLSFDGETIHQYGQVVAKK